MHNFYSELGTIMNYFALVDKCQNGEYTIKFCTSAMTRFRKLIKSNLIHAETQKLFEELESVFFTTKE